MRKHLLTATAAAAVATGTLALATPAPSGAAAWIANGSIGSLDGPSTSLDVASTGAGDAIAVWTADLPGNDRVFVARATNGDWQPAVPLSPVDQNASDVHIAANESGDAVVTWEHPGGGPGLRVLSGRRLNGNTWSATTNLVPTPSDDTLMHDVAVDDTGHAVVSYRVADDANSTALISDWIGAEVTSTPIEPGAGTEHWPTLAANAAGDVLVSFARAGSIYTTYRQAGSSTWTEAKPVIKSISDARSWSALRPNGSGVVAAIQAGAPKLVRAAQVSATGVPGAATTVSDPAKQTGSAISVVANADGDVLITWETANNNDLGIDYSLRPAGAGYGAPTVLADPASDIHFDSATVLTDDDLRVVLARQNPSLAVWHRATGFQSDWEKHSPGLMASSSPYALDADAEGNVVVVGASTDDVHAEFLDAAGPTVAIGTLPANMLANPPLPMTTFPIAWTMADSLSNIPSSDIYATRAAWNESGHSDPQILVNDVPGTEADIPWKLGTSYCLQVRSTDAAGNSSTSAKKCTTVPLDDRSLVGDGWTKVVKSGNFRNTLLTTDVKGRQLVRKGIKAKRLALVVRKTDNSGTVRVFFAGETLGSYSLDGTGKKKVIQLATFPTVKSGTLTIRVISPNGKLVSIDGVVVAK